MDVTSCPVWGQCGGCSAESSLDPYLRQAEAVNFYLHPRPRVGRRRVLLRVHAGTRTCVGFFKRGTRELCEINACPASHPLITEVIGRLRQFSCDEACRFQVLVDVVHQPEPEVYLMIRSIPEDSPVKWRLQEALSPWFHVRLHGDPSPLLYCHEDELWIHLDGFRQVNGEVNRQLRDFLHHEPRSESVLDICAGNGNLGLAHSTLQRYTAIETNAFARDALAINTRTIKTSIRTQLDDSVEPHDTVIYDPPRRPLGIDWRQLKKQARQKFYYASCDVRHLPHDCFSDPDLESVQLFDMFHGSTTMEALLVFRANTQEAKA